MIYTSVVGDTSACYKSIEQSRTKGNTNLRPPGPMCLSGFDQRILCKIPCSVPMWLSKWITLTGPQ
jgi:hypothetical protein